MGSLPVRAAQLVLVVPGIAVMTVLNSSASWSPDLPVNPVAVMFGVIVLGHYVFTAGPRPHNLVTRGTVVAVPRFRSGTWTGRSRRPH